VHTERVKVQHEWPALGEVPSFPQPYPMPFCANERRPLSMESSCEWTASNQVIPTDCTNGPRGESSFGRVFHAGGFLVIYGAPLTGE
jgi:hypothetical protein